MEEDTMHTPETVAEHLAFLEARHPRNMTDREMMTELVLGQREMRQLVKKFIADTVQNPMFATMGRMFGGGKKG
jgi:hypothetical protein